MIHSIQARRCHLSLERQSAGAIRWVDDSTGKWTGKALGQSRLKPDRDFGMVLEVLGATDGYRLEPEARLEPASLSLALWVRPTGNVGAYADLIRKGSGAGGYWLRWRHQDDTADRLSFRGVNPSFIVPLPMANTVLLDRWCHIVGTFDAASGVARLYLDGRLMGSATTTTIGLTHSEPLFIGHAPGYPGQQFVGGRYASVQLFPFALSPGQVWLLAQRRMVAQRDPWIQE